MRILVLTVLAAFGAGSALAATAWTATSTTAISITGDIVVEEERIVFANGAELRIVPVDPEVAGVYRVEPPADPELENGNRLCGRDLVRFVALGRSADSASLSDSPSLFLKVFDGDSPPPASAAVGMSAGGAGLCATYNYAR